MGNWTGVVGLRCLAESIDRNRVALYLLGTLSINESTDIFSEPQVERFVDQRQVGAGGFVLIDSM